jgi:predicted MFS family arabinose efflux permease
MSTPTTRARPATLVLLATGMATAAAAANGYARFGYALVLPDMRADLHWSLTTAGALNTANALGYLAGAVLAALIASRFGERGTLLGSLALTTASVLACPLTTNLAALLTLRLLAGIGAAVTFIAGGVVTVRLGRHSTPGRAALLLGIYCSGPGLGIATSGLAVPLFSDIGGWRAAWLTLGTLGLICCLTAGYTMSRVEPPRLTPGQRPSRWPASKMTALLVSYGLFGAGYIAYMTFVIELLKDHGAGPGEITLFWVLLGVAAVAGGFAWSPVFGSLPGGPACAIVLGVTTGGALLPLLVDSPIAYYASALIFGASFLSVVTAVTACARRNLAPEHWTAAIAWLTVCFALGQCAGPLLAGVLSDQAGGVRTGLLIGAAVLFASTLVVLGQRSPQPAPVEEPRCAAAQVSPD